MLYKQTKQKIIKKSLKIIKITNNNNNNKKKKNQIQILKKI